MRAGEIDRIDRAARKGFVYRPDGLTDVWRSLANQPGERVGDCDDLASTALDLLGRSGLALDRRWRLLVSAAGGQPFDHMIGCAVDDGGGLWIVGDTFGRCYPAGAMRHAPAFSNRLDERHPGGEPLWREGAPWIRRRQPAS